MESLTDNYIKGAVEALLFISEKPVSLEQLKDALESVGTADIKRAIGELMNDYLAQQRGMVITEIAGGYQMLSSPGFAGYVRNFFKTRVKEKLSRPSLETLAIIAYKQPVCRGDVELIRGVNSDGIVINLFEKGLIKVVGRKDVPGRPFLYGTTKLFLEYFGLKALDDLPKLEDMSALLQGQEDVRVLPLNDNDPVPTREEVIQGDPVLSQEMARRETDSESPVEGDAAPDAVQPGEGANRQDSDFSLERGASEVNLPQEKMEDAHRLKEIMDEIQKDEPLAEPSVEKVVEGED